MTTTEPTTAKTYPRYRRNLGLRNGRELAVPLPPLLVERMGNAREVVEHRRVAARLDEPPRRGADAGGGAASGAGRAPRTPSVLR